MSHTAQNERPRDLFALMAAVRANDCNSQSLLRHARYFEIESRLIESSRNCISESRELLTRVDALLSQSAPLSFGKERGSQREALRKAI
jgi:hypothetical protein